ncbi:MAG: hypothetical protein Kow0092_37150 [Deferrisomatales bacterium]
MPPFRPGAKRAPLGDTPTPRNAAPPGAPAGGLAETDRLLGLHYTRRGGKLTDDRLPPPSPVGLPFNRLPPFLSGAMHGSTRVQETSKSSSRPSHSRGIGGHAVTRGEP